MTIDPPDAVVGALTEIWLHPVKSLAGHRVPQAAVEPGGLQGDRAWSVLDAASGQRIRPRDVPGLAAVTPTGDPARDAETLGALLGRPVRLAGTESAQVDVAPVHLVSRQARERAAAGTVPEGCSADDPRANLVLDLPPGADEREWVGCAVRIGEAELQVTRTPKHCLGVYAEVRRPGTVRAGDRVQVVRGPAGP